MLNEYSLFNNLKRGYINWKKKKLSTLKNWKFKTDKLFTSFLCQNCKDIYFFLSRFWAHFLFFNIPEPILSLKDERYLFKWIPTRLLIFLNVSRSATCANSALEQRSFLLLATKELRLSLQKHWQNQFFWGIGL